MNFENQFHDACGMVIGDINFEFPQLYMEYN